MHHLVVERTQHPIGQGGFHLSYLYANGSRFSLVYDCGGGTSHSRQQLIEDCVGASELEYDWLVISHLDADHINGIPQLEKEGVTFSNVFLPHVDLPLSMFFMLLKMIGANLGAVTSAQLASLLIAGRLYAGAYGRVRIVRRGDRGDNDPPLPPDLPDLTPPNRSEANNMPSDLLSVEARRSLGAAGRHNFPDTQSIQMNSIDWQFRFYSQEWTTPASVQTIWDLPVLKSLRNAINHLGLLGTNHGKNFTTGIAAELNATISAADANSALAAINPKAAKIRAKISINTLLKKLYALVPELHGYNGSSLCLYSGPAGLPAHTLRQWYVRRNSLPMPGLGAVGSTRAVGWLGMGDAHLHTDHELLTFRDHYRHELRLLSTLMLPHHGSRHNYDIDQVQLHGLLNALPAEPKPILIAASNPEHKAFGHPHTAVVATAGRYGIVHNVNLDRRTTFEESIMSDPPRYCSYCY